MHDPQETTWAAGPDSETRPSPKGRWEEKPPERIGPFTIKDKLGEGGFGQVFLAEQTEPLVRKVAIKIIKPGMDSASVVRRFEQERQALAVMNHPGVARVYDGGVTEAGRPFFVMEFVDGKPLTRFADAERLTMRQRVELMIQVAEAVHHAHMKGVIHRDLKPGNILARTVDGKPRITVIDFGVAKALRRGEDGFASEAMTEAGQVIGSRDYMSPEQADSGPEDIDTRTDVYALGVVLYELLTGVTPFDKEALRSASFMELQKIIRMVDPARPSLRFRDLAATQTLRPDPQTQPEVLSWHRQTEVRVLQRLLKGELDWICMKCLEKDRDRRYDNAGALAEELQRFLRGDPVLAGPPSGWYRAQKFARRHTAGVAAAAIVLVALVAAAGVSTAFGLSEASQRRAADRAKQNLETVVDFQNDMLGSVNKARMGASVTDRMRSEINRTLTERGATPEQVDQLLAYFEGTLGLADTAALAMAVVQQNMLDDAVHLIERQYAGDPALEASLRETVGDTYLALGRHAEAEEQITRAIALRTEALGPAAPDTLEAINSLGMVQEATGRLDEAQASYTTARDGLRRALGPTNRETLRVTGNLAMLLLARGDAAGAIPFATEAATGLAAVLGPTHADTLAARNNLGAVYLEAADFPRAESELRAALAGRRTLLGDDHQATLTSVHNLALALMQQNQLAAAEPLAIEAVTGRRAALGADHPDTLASLANLGRMLMQQNRPAEAEPILADAARGFERLHGPDHPDTVLALNLYAGAVYAQGRLAEAESVYRTVLDRRRATLGADHPRTLGTMSSLGTLLVASGQTAEGERLLDEALRGSRDRLGPAHPDTLRALAAHAVALETLGKLDEAETELAEAVRLARGNADTPPHPELGVYLHRHGIVLGRLQRWTDAERTLLEAHAVLTQTRGPADPRTLNAAATLAGFYEGWAQSDSDSDPDPARAKAAARWRAAAEAP